jgi:hypothetical protein
VKEFFHGTFFSLTIGIFCKLNFATMHTEEKYFSIADPNSAFGVAGAALFRIQK